MIPQLPPDAMAVRDLRPDLQTAFDITTDRGRTGLFWWYFCRGRRELPVALEPGWASSQFVNEPQAHVEQLSFLPITRLMWQLCCSASPDPGIIRNGKTVWGRIARLLRLSFVDRLDRRDQEAILAWYFMNEIVEANLEPLLTSDQANGLLAPDPSGTTCFERLIWQHDAEPRERFAGVDDAEYRKWIRREAPRKYRLLSHPKIGLADEMRHPLRPLSSGRRPFGVNLYGHPGARLGVGEDVRMAATALSFVGIPFTLQSVKLNELPDEEIVQSITNPVDYAFNLFCMTGLETFTFSQQRGRTILDGHYNIGFWPWELPKWPALFQGCFELADEVWASSRFTAKSLEAAAPLPVRHLPMAVTAEATEGLSRNDFGLPQESFLFGFMLDGNSGFERKNPLACIRAFQMAFPSDRGVGLVIKAQRVNGLPAWSEVERAADGDSRIQLLTGSYSRGRLLDLHRAMDAFVSLHRSEGFGRNLAEAMLLGKPVIATNYSGNCDFTTDSTAMLIKASEVAVGNGDYRFGSGMTWGEPDVECAAQAMIKLRNEEAVRTHLSEAGQRAVSEMFDPIAVGRKYRLVLEQIFAEGLTN